MELFTEICLRWSYFKSLNMHSKNISKECTEFRFLRWVILSHHSVFVGMEVWRENKTKSVCMCDRIARWTVCPNCEFHVVFCLKEKNIPNILSRSLSSSVYFMRWDLIDGVSRQMPNQKKRVWRRKKNSFIYIQGGRGKQIILGTHPWQRKQTETS